MSDVLSRTLLVYGLAIAVSIGIAIAIKLVVWAIQALERRPASEPAEPAPASADVGADHIAAISAAVYAVIGAHRIVHIEAAHRGTGWVTEGRVAHHGSHGVSHRSRAR